MTEDQENTRYQDSLRDRVHNTVRVGAAIGTGTAAYLAFTAQGNPDMGFVATLPAIYGGYMAPEIARVALARASEKGVELAASSCRAVDNAVKRASIGLARRARGSREHFLKLEDKNEKGYALQAQLVEMGQRISDKTEEIYKLGGNDEWIQQSLEALREETAKRERERQQQIEFSENNAREKARAARTKQVNLLGRNIYIEGKAPKPPKEHSKLEPMIALMRVLPGVRQHEEEYLKGAEKVDELEVNVLPEAKKTMGYYDVMIDALKQMKQREKQPKRKPAA